MIKLKLIKAADTVHLCLKKLDLEKKIAIKSVTFYY